MSLEQLMGRYFRLAQELAIARKSQPWQTGLIARLAKELTLVEREVAGRGTPGSPRPTPCGTLPEAARP
jgi:hypothetical protein